MHTTTFKAVLLLTASQFYNYVPQFHSVLLMKISFKTKAVCESCRVCVSVSVWISVCETEIIRCQLSRESDCCGAQSKSMNNQSNTVLTTITTVSTHIYTYDGYDVNDASGLGLRFLWESNYLLLIIIILDSQIFLYLGTAVPHQIRLLEIKCRP